MVKKIVIIYILLACIIAGYSMLSTKTERGELRAKVVNVFNLPSLVVNYLLEPELDGQSVGQWNTSLNELIGSRRDPHEQFLAKVAVSQVYLLDYVEHSTTLTKAELQRLLKLSNASALPDAEKISYLSDLQKMTYVANMTDKVRYPDKFDLAIRMNDKRVSRVAGQLDGYDYLELINSGKYALSKVLSISQRMAETDTLGLTSLNPEYSRDMIED